MLISAPLGPIGILCIQRTLNKGRKVGFITGLGAATSDLIYGLLTGFCISIVVDFIESYQVPLQLGGSCILLGFGYFLYTQNPTRNIQKPEEDKDSNTQNYLTAFFLTLSNPFILFLYIALFARFSFAAHDNNWLHIIVGYLSIFLGATMWWTILTYFIDKIRSRFNLRSLHIVNRLIGSAVIVMSLVGLASGVKQLLS